MSYLHIILSARRTRAARYWFYLRLRCL